MVIRRPCAALMTAGIDKWYNDIVRACEANEGQWERWQWRNRTLFRRDEYGDDRIVLRCQATILQALTKAHKKTCKCKINA